MNFSGFFDDGDYRFQLGLRRGQPEAFFRPVNPALTAERRQWLQGKERFLYAALLPEGVPMLRECLALAGEWGTISREAADSVPPESDLPAEPCARLGEIWEPDFLLVRARDDFQLMGGCVCFPSSWSLAGKPGLSLAAIHGAVPGLNASLGQNIGKLLSGLTPGTAYFRHNWGLSRSPELNQHPNRNLPRLDAAVALDEIWLRIEHQSLVLLPESGGILFGIRIAMHPLAQVRQDSVAAGRMVRALRTMPEEVVAYKGLATSRERIETLMLEP